VCGCRLGFSRLGDFSLFLLLNETDEKKENSKGSGKDCKALISNSMLL